MKVLPDLQADILDKVFFNEVEIFNRQFSRKRILSDTFLGEFFTFLRVDILQITWELLVLFLSHIQKKKKKKKKRMKEKRKKMREA